MTLREKWKQIFSFNAPPSPNSSNKKFNPAPSPTQNQTRLWLAKIHPRVSWTITPLIILHIRRVEGVKSFGGGGGLYLHLVRSMFVCW